MTKCMAHPTSLLLLLASGTNTVWGIERLVHTNVRDLIR